MNRKKVAAPLSEGGYETLGSPTSRKTDFVTYGHGRTNRKENAHDLLADG
jgi:hypothetical protein